MTHNAIMKRLSYSQAFDTMRPWQILEVVHIIKSEHARSRRVVREIRAVYHFSDRFDVGVRKACDEILWRLK